MYQGSTTMEYRTIPGIHRVRSTSRQSRRAAAKTTMIIPASAGATGPLARVPMAMKK